MSPGWSSTRRRFGRRASCSDNASTSSWPATRSTARWSPSSKSCTTRPSSSPICWEPAASRPATSWPPSAAAYRALELAPGDERWYTNAVTSADVDGDGHLDLVIGNYFRDGARILEACGGEAATVDQLVSRTRLPPEAVTVALRALERQGWAEHRRGWWWPR